MRRLPPAQKEAVEEALMLAPTFARRQRATDGVRPDIRAVQ